MSRPAIAAWYRCQTSVFSLSGRSRKPSAYTCTTAASSTRSSRYVRSADAGAGAFGAGGAAGAGVVAFELEPPPHAAIPHMVMRAAILFMGPQVRLKPDTTYGRSG